MRFRADIAVTAGIVLLCAYAVMRQMGYDPFASPESEIQRLDTGDVLDGDLVLNWIGTPPFPDRIGKLFGERATVIYTWSVPCPCTTVLEERLKAVHERLGPEQGVGWFAVDGEPYDTPGLVIQHMGELHAFYRLVLDPYQRLTQRLGLKQAVHVVVLDAEHRIRYRGAIDDDYEGGDARFLVDALERVLAGSPIELDERRADYGCFFNDPASCLEFGLEPGEGTPAASE